MQDDASSDVGSLMPLWGAGKSPEERVEVANAAMKAIGEKHGGPVQYVHHLLEVNQKNDDVIFAASVAGRYSNWLKITFPGKDDVFYQESPDLPWI
eukprot:1980415-Karenia_brevis.AAC.1